MWFEHVMTDYVAPTHYIMTHYIPPTHYIAPTLHTAALERVAPPWKQVNNDCLGSLGAILSSATVAPTVHCVHSTVALDRIAPPWKQATNNLSGLHRGRERHCTCRCNVLCGRNVVAATYSSRNIKCCSKELRLLGAQTSKEYYLLGSTGAQFFRAPL